MRCSIGWALAATLIASACDASHPAGADDGGIDAATDALFDGSGADHVAATDAMTVDAAAADDDGGIAVEHFCERFETAICNLEAACACARPLADCLSSGMFNCPLDFFMPGAMADLGSGRLRYDPVAAAALVARLDARPPDCRGGYVALGLPMRATPTLGGVFVGTLPVGSPCTQIGTEVGVPNECAPPSYCSISAGTCVPEPFFGDPCGTSIGACVNPDAYPDDEDYYLVGRCVPDASGTPICQPRGATGATCVMDRDCLSLHCVSSMCTAPLADGAPCMDRHECASASCTGPPGVPTCTPGGTWCPSSYECGSGLCVGTACAGRICHTL